MVATERHDEPIILDNLHRSIQLNREDLAAKAVHICVQPFSWDLLDGLIGGLTDETSEKGYDIILGSDLFYSGESFDPILAVVSNQRHLLICHTSVHTRNLTFFLHYVRC